MPRPPVVALPDSGGGVPPPELYGLPNFECEYTEPEKAMLVVVELMMPRAARVVSNRPCANNGILTIDKWAPAHTFAVSKMDIKKWAGQAYHMEPNSPTDKYKGCGLSPDRSTGLYH
ncbi:unnamed protein product [Ilex paraguariensis]|uniref:Uncharacterized protein n=1 Tax=Ilex paraguariensis TaxID=185542 RepID=A0ABC8V4E0_9AQUA